MTMEMLVGDAAFWRDDSDGRATLHVSGEIDLATAPALRAELRTLIAEAHSPGIVNLSAVTFMDASGLSALLQARRAVRGTEVTLWS